MEWLTEVNFIGKIGWNQRWRRWREGIARADEETDPALTVEVAAWDNLGSPQSRPFVEAKTCVCPPVWMSLKWSGNVTLPKSFFWLSS